MNELTNILRLKGNNPLHSLFYYFHQLLLLVSLRFLASLTGAHFMARERLETLHVHWNKSFNDDSFLIPSARQWDNINHNKMATVELSKIVEDFCWCPEPPSRIINKWRRNWAGNVRKQEVKRIVKVFCLSFVAVIKSDDSWNSSLVVG